MLHKQEKVVYDRSTMEKGEEQKGDKPVRRQNYRASLFDDAQDGIPEGPACLRVHACRWLILRTFRHKKLAAALNLSSFELKLVLSH